MKDDSFLYMDWQNSLAPANLQEYFTMMAGGLAGASSHMISATILAITRFIFEFSSTLVLIFNK